MKIIACDFDGTLCENEFPKIGKPKSKVIERLLLEKANGAKIILWTCREGIMLSDAVSWCKDHGIEFDAVNEDLPETLLWMKEKSKKVYATEYWDDKAVNIL